MKTPTHAALDMLKPRNFEEYLGYVFMEDEPESVGNKDTFDDNLDQWLEYQGAAIIIELADKYATWKSS